MNFLDEIGECVPRQYKTSKESEEVALLLKQGLSQGASRGLETVRFVRKSAWDQLNIGVYSDIDPLWRQAFYDASVIMSCQMIELGFDQKQIYRVIDEGLLMGQADQYSTLQFIVIKLKGAESSDDEISIPSSLFEYTDALPQVTIKVMKQPPSMVEWLNIKRNKQPVLIKNAVNEWPALSKWNFDYFFRLMKNRTVPIEIGEKYTDKDWGQQLQTFETFLKAILSKEAKHYLAQHPLLVQIPELEDDIIVPDYCFIDNQIDDAEVNAWIGPEGTVSSLHTDNKDNLFVQVKGAKIFKLIHPSHEIEPIDGVMFNSSKFNPEAYTGSEIEIETVVVEPGDMLYIPKLHWHYVRSISASISISMWF